MMELKIIGLNFGIDQKIFEAIEGFLETEDFGDWRSFERLKASERVKTFRETENHWSDGKMI